MLPLFDQLAWLIALTWFFIYWVIGGTVFAVYALARASHIRPLQFSCFFSLLTMMSSVAAGWMGMNAVREIHPRCGSGVNTLSEGVKAVLGCGLNQILFSGVLWACFLLSVGALIFALSHRRSAR